MLHNNEMRFLQGTQNASDKDGIGVDADCDPIRGDDLLPILFSQSYLIEDMQRNGEMDHTDRHEYSP
jgi:hypothetical protein